MTGTLLRKELHQNGLALGLSVVMGGLLFIWVFFSQMAANAGSGSALQPLALYLLYGFPLILLIVCRRLVVGEYMAQTHLFLESLPLPRLRFLLVKYLLGLFVALLIVGLALGTSLLFSARNEDLTPRFLAILVSRSFVYAGFVYSFFFAMGFFGRLRFIVYLVVGLSFMIANSAGADISRFYPFPLMQEAFAFERENFPVGNLIGTGLLALGLTVLAFGLATIADGALATRLGTRMSHGEKTTLLALVLAMVSLAFIVDSRKEKAPYDLQEAAAGHVRGVTVKMLPEEPEITTLAAEFAEEFADLHEFLGLKPEDSPPLFFIDRPDLDPHLFESGVLIESEGIVARANFRAPEFDRARFIEWVVRSLLYDLTKGRAAEEERLWIARGFALKWARRHDESELPRDLQLRALAALGGATQITGDHLDDWQVRTDGVGDEVATGLAWSGHELIAHSAGIEGYRNWIRSVFKPVRQRNASVNIREWIDSDWKKLKRHTGLRQKDLLAGWNRRLADWSDAHSETVANLPMLKAEFWFEPAAEGSETHRGRFRVHPIPEPDRLERVHLWYATLDPFAFSAYVADFQKDRIEPRADAALKGNLDGDYPRGTRIAATVIAWCPELQCEVISGWQRPYAGEQAPPKNP